MGKSHKITHPKKAAFLSAYAICGTVTAASRMADISRHTHYDWLANDADGSYAKAFADAKEEAVERLEHEARRRAIEGVKKPLFYKGEPIRDDSQAPVVLREYSDTLLIFLLKAARPEVYRDRPVVTVDNSQHEHHTHQYGELEEDELDRLVADRRTRFARIQGEVAGGNGSAGPRGDGAGGGNGRKKDS